MGQREYQASVEQKDLNLQETYRCVRDIRTQIIQRIEQLLKTNLEVVHGHGYRMQAREQTAGEFTGAGSLVQGQANSFLDNLRVIFLAAEFFHRTNDFVRVTRVKVLVDASRELDFELTQGEHGPIHSLGSSRIVPTLLRSLINTTQDVSIQILRLVVERIVLVHGNFLHIRRVHHVFPLSLSVASLFLMHTIEITRIAIGRLLSSNVTLRRAFLDACLVFDHSDRHPFLL